MEYAIADTRDQTLAALLRAGDARAYEAVYETFVQDVMTLLAQGICYSGEHGRQGRVHVASAFDREELCQETFAQFFRQHARGRFDPERPILPYLRRIALNLTFRHLRQRSREAPHERETEDTSTPVRSATQKEAARLVGEFERTLDTRDRSVLHHYFEGDSSQQQVGAQLSLSRDQVYRSIVRIQRAARSFFGARGWLDD